MTNVEIEEKLYDELNGHLEKRRSKNPYMSHSIKDFVNIAVKEKIDTDNLSIAMRD